MVSELGGLAALVRTQQLRGLSHAHVRDLADVFSLRSLEVRPEFYAAVVRNNRCARRIAWIRGRTLLFRSAESRTALEAGAQQPKSKPEILKHGGNGGKAEVTEGRKDFKFSNSKLQI